MHCIISHLFWEEPSSFRPERFADPKQDSLCSHLPFDGGPIIFIGANFALQEAFIILATLLKQDRFAHVKGHETSPEMTLTLRPERGVCLMTDPIDTTNSTALGTLCALIPFKHANVLIRESGTAPSKLKIKPKLKFSEFTLRSKIYTF